LFVGKSSMGMNCSVAFAVTVCGFFVGDLLLFGFAVPGDGPRLVATS